MTAATVNLAIEQGATFVKSLLWQAGDPLAPLNLTGYTARMQIRPSVGSYEVLLELTSSAGIALGGAAGTIVITITAAQTAAMTKLSGVYDLEMINGAVVTRLAQGTVTVSPEVTR